MYHNPLTIDDFANGEITIIRLGRDAYPVVDRYGVRAIPFPMCVMRAINPHRSTRWSLAMVSRWADGLASDIMDVPHSRAIAPVDCFDRDSDDDFSVETRRPVIRSIYLRPRSLSGSFPIVSAISVSVLLPVSTI